MNFGGTLILSPAAHKAVCSFSENEVPKPGDIGSSVQEETDQAK